MNLVKLSAILVGLLAITTIVTRVEAAEGDTGDGNDTNEGTNASEGGAGEETASTATDSEETNAFCASVPSAEDIAEMGTFEYYFPNCDNERCPEEGETPDLSVLTYTMKCLREACDGSAKQAGIDKCIKQLEIQQKNIFQFKPENYEQQLDKACDCKYGDVKKFSTGGDDPTTVCDAKWVHNCRIPSAGGACMNAMGLMVYDGYCESTEKKPEHVEERIEYFRVRKLCETSVKSMLLNEDIVEPRCKYNWELQDDLIKACDNGCYYYPFEGSFIIHPDYQYVQYSMPTDKPFYQYANPDDFKAEKGCYLYQVDGKDYYVNTVYHQGNRNVWWNMMDFCEEFHKDGGTQPPKQLRFSPITRNINPLDKITKAFTDCCPAAGTYEPGTRDKKSLNGKTETDCMMDKGVFIDFGFIPGLIRGAIQRSSGLCYELYSTITPCADPPKEEPETEEERIKMEEREAELKCKKEVDLDKDQMELKAGQVSPSEVFWFLKYIPEDHKAVRASVLRGCAEGAKMGRTVTVLPGLSLGLEAQQYAVSEVPVGFQTHSMLAYHTCAVFASVHENKYFDRSEGVGCNQYALDPTAYQVDDATCNSA